MSSIGHGGHTWPRVHLKEILFGTIAAGSLGGVFFALKNEGVRLPELVNPVADNPALQKLTFKETLSRDTTFLIKHLGDLRRSIAWRNHEHNPNVRNITLNIEAGIRKIDWIKKAEKYEGYNPIAQATLDTVYDQLQKVRAINLNIMEQSLTDENRINISDEDRFELLKTCGLLRGLEVQANAKADPVKVWKKPFQTIIMDVTPEPVSGEVSIKYGVGTVLRALWYLEEDTDRRKLNIGITNSDTGRVLKITPIFDPSYKKDKPLQIDFQNDITIKDVLYQVNMPMKQTIDRVNTGWIGIGWATNGALIIRNSLMQECPVNQDFGISQYDTCLTISPNSNPGHEGETLIRFDVSSSLIFYKNSAYETGERANKVKGAAERLYKRRDGGLQMAEKLINDLMEFGAAKAFKDIELPKDPDVIAVKK